MCFLLQWFYLELEMFILQIIESERYTLTNVLVVKANNRPADQAVSSKMYETFMGEIKGLTLMFLYMMYMKKTLHILGRIFLKHSVKYKMVKNYLIFKNAH